LIHFYKRCEMSSEVRTSKVNFAPSLSPPLNPDLGTQHGRTLLIKKEAFAYKIPPQDAVIKFLIQTQAVEWKASEWNLKRPDWSGKIRLVSHGRAAVLQLYDGDYDDLYAECLVETFPGTDIMKVADSSRFYVMKVREAGKVIHLGLGFAERSDSFALNTALQDHFRDEEISELEEEVPLKKLDLALKEGETMKVSLNFSRKSDECSTVRRELPSPPGPPSPALTRRDSGAKAAEGQKKSRWSLVRQAFLRRKQYSEKI